jgi:V/A-type H+/Na+-transporting ATPase subunit F
MSSKKRENIKSIAVIGEREIVMGYRLLGVEDTFTVNDKNEAVKKMENLFTSHKYNLIIASQFVQDSLSQLMRSKIESSIDPLVIFMPALQGTIHEESIAALAKRVLGISIKTGK